MVIGKIPGYNPKINPLNSSGINYEDRLTNNIAVLTMKPTGFVLNLGWGSLDKKTEIFSVGVETKSPSLTSMIPDFVKNMFTDSSTHNSTNTNTSTKKASDMWKLLVEANKDATGIDSDDITDIELLLSNDSTLNETFTNQSTTHPMQQVISGINGGIRNSKGGDGLMGSVAGMYDTAASAIGFGGSLLSKTHTISNIAALELIKVKGGAASLQNLITNNMLGIKTALPMVWESSSYNNNMIVMLKLISPSGHSSDIEEYIIKPIMALIMMTAPTTSDGIGYGTPFLWDISSTGLIDLKLGWISALNIVRGGSDTMFNDAGMPLNVDVRISIEPLVDQYAVSFNEKLAIKTSSLLTLLDTKKSLTSEKKLPKQLSIYAKQEEKESSWKDKVYGTTQSDIQISDILGQF